ncbi:hypothetical protein ACOSP7_029900 [Xanthoceras sorbifolium]
MFLRKFVSFCGRPATIGCPASLICSLCLSLISWSWWCGAFGIVGIVGCILRLLFLCVVSLIGLKVFSVNFRLLSSPPGADSGLCHSASSCLHPARWKKPDHGCYKHNSDASTDYQTSWWD